LRFERERVEKKEKKKGNDDDVMMLRVSRTREREYSYICKTGEPLAI
jgi:hypothetical protein